MLEGLGKHLLMLFFKLISKDLVLNMFSCGALVASMLAYVERTVRHAAYATSDIANKMNYKKKFLRQLLLSRFHTKTQRVNKIVMNGFSKAYWSK